MGERREKRAGRGGGGGGGGRRTRRNAGGGEEGDRADGEGGCGRSTDVGGRQGRGRGRQRTVAMRLARPSRHSISRFINQLAPRADPGVQSQRGNYDGRLVSAVPLRATRTLSHVQGRGALHGLQQARAARHPSGELGGGTSARERHGRVPIQGAALPATPQDVAIILRLSRFGASRSERVPRADPTPSELRRAGSPRPTNTTPRRRARSSESPRRRTSAWSSTPPPCPPASG